jgi:glycosyltransferase involved in cell wall biosynthesis
VSAVCFFGGYDAGYPRNRILRAGLEQSGVEVLECRAPGQWRAFRRYPALAARFARGGRAAGVLLVAEFRHKDMPLARCLKGRRRLIFDPFVSREDTLVGDWGMHQPGSLQARWNGMWDRWSLALADTVLCDTWEHGKLYQALGVPAERLVRVLVGAEDRFFEVPDYVPRPGRLRVLYVGGFLPLHGVSVLLEAADRLKARADLPDYEIVMAGSGRERERAGAFAAERGLPAVRFTGEWPYPRLPELLATADLVLGAFGAGGKAGRVIPHKVYQGVAAGRAVLTGDSPALREVFEPERHVAAVTRGDPDELAATLAALLADTERRTRLARSGRARAREVGAPGPIGRSLAEALGLGADASAGRAG